MYDVRATVDRLIRARLWSREGRSHLKWLLRKARADFADRAGRSFEYRHPVVGPFIYHPSDWMSRRLFLYGDFETSEIRFAMEQARGGGTILDVGANIGLYTVACARAAGPRGRVIALEPGPATFAKLTDTCAQLGLSNVVLVNAAAGSTHGSAVLVVSDPARDVHQHLFDSRSGDGGGTHIPVAMVRLDDVCGGDVKSVVLMKLDVEGHEVDVLNGAEQILGNGCARLIVEFYPAGLKAAGCSVDALWARLARTHTCIGIARQDNSKVVPELSTMLAARDDETLNALWLPRGMSA